MLTIRSLEEYKNLPREVTDVELNFTANKIIIRNHIKNIKFTHNNCCKVKPKLPNSNKTLSFCKYKIEIPNSVKHINYSNVKLNNKIITIDAVNYIKISAVNNNNILFLHIPKAKIKNLSALKNAHKLFLRNSSVTDTSGIKNIHTLDLSDTKIKDFSSFKPLKI